MIPQKLQEVGCTSTNTHTSYRGEFIYIQNGCYYPSVCNGYKDAAKCATLEDAQKWIDEKKNEVGQG